MAASMRTYPPLSLLRSAAERHGLQVEEITGTHVRMDGPHLASEYWDCNCPDGAGVPYIHKKSDGPFRPDSEGVVVPFCGTCDSNECDNPDAHLNEVLADVIKDPAVLNWYARQNSVREVLERALKENGTTMPATVHCGSCLADVTPTNYEEFHVTSSGATQERMWQCDDLDACQERSLGLTFVVRCETPGCIQQHEIINAINLAVVGSRDEIRVGDSVYWNDPGEDLASGIYTVAKVPVEDGVRLSDDTIVLLTSSRGVAEVYARELSIPADGFAEAFGHGGEDSADYCLGCGQLGILEDFGLNDRTPNLLASRPEEHLAGGLADIVVKRGLVAPFPKSADAHGSVWTQGHGRFRFQARP